MGFEVSSSQNPFAAFPFPRFPKCHEFGLRCALKLELMPGSVGRMRPALVACIWRPRFLRAQGLFSECSATPCARSLVGRAAGACEPWHRSQRCVVRRPRSFGTGIAAVAASEDTNQAHAAVSSCASGSYKTLAQPCSLTLEVKRSRFIASAISVDDEAAALAFLSQVRDTSASHNCWAFKIGDRTRFSDDGEPGGTAGRPMLTAITASGIDRVMVVVTRFFGGTKLGTGGLVRAYGKVTSDCLKDVETIIVKAKVSCKIRAPYDVLGLLYALLETYGVQKLEESFDTEGEGGVTMNLMVDAESVQLFVKDLELTSRGRASLSDVVS